MKETWITVQANVKASLESVWRMWTEPEHIVHWNSATEDWYSPSANNDLRVGGHFVYRMAARDGSAAFDFSGVYTEVILRERIAFTLGDGRQVWISFAQEKEQVAVTEAFQAESENSEALQRAGWQAIMNHFKQYAEQC